MFIQTAPFLFIDYVIIYLRYINNINFIFMKKSYVAMGILVVVVLIVFVFTGKGQKLEAPTVPNDISDTSNEEGSMPPISNTMPAVEGDFSVEEMIVEGVKEFVVEGKNMSFTPAVLNVKKGDLVKITFKNTQGFHDFKIDEFGAATKQIKSPDTEVLEFTADKVGSFEYYCSVGSHRSMGMVGILNVTE